MKVLRLRTHYGIPALKGEDNWNADDPGTALRMLPCGHFVVSRHGKHELIPAAAVRSAGVEPEPALSLGLIAKAMAKGDSMGEADPPMVASSETVAALRDEYAEPLPHTSTQKRGPGRPKKEQAQG